MIYLGGFLVLSILVNVFLLAAINSRDKEIVFLNQIYLSCESQLFKTLKDLDRYKGEVEK